MPALAPNIDFAQAALAANGTNLIAGEVSQKAYAGRRKSVVILGICLSKKNFSLSSAK